MSGALSVALVVLVLSGPAAAASLTLSQGEKTEALRVGRRSITLETFDTEWRAVNGRAETVLVITPFHRLVLAARNAAFKNERMKPDEPDKILKEHGARVLFWVTLRGDREDFARFYEPRLVGGDLEIEPTFVQNERTAVRDASGAFLARCAYGFPTKELSGKSRVALVIRDVDGRDVSRFAVDLSAMR